jgi:hypothetical protein
MTLNEFLKQYFPNSRFNEDANNRFFSNVVLTVENEIVSCLVGDFRFTVSLKTLQESKDAYEYILDEIDNLNTYHAVCVIQRNDHKSSIDSAFMSMSDLLVETASIKDSVDTRIYEKTCNGSVVKKGHLLIEKTEDSIKFSCVWDIIK